MTSQVNKILHSGVLNEETETELVSYCVQGMTGAAGTVWKWILEALCKKTQLSKRVGHRMERWGKGAAGALILLGFLLSAPVSPGCALALSFGFHEILRGIFLSWAQLSGLLYLATKRTCLELELDGHHFRFHWRHFLFCIISYSLWIVLTSPFRLGAFWGQHSVYFRGS